jgi:Cft2 family RNA processing exonuclease
MKYEIINSGSDGNCIIINGNFMIDCGVSYKRIKNLLKNIKLIFVSHSHSDHLNKKTIKQITYNFPTIKFVVGSTDLVNTLVEHSNVNKKNIYALPSNKWFDLGMLKVKLEQLEHDVPNHLIKFQIGAKKGVYIVDTNSVKNIKAKDYDLFLIEANYKKEILEKHKQEKNENDEYNHLYRVENTHLSYEEANDFLIENMKGDSQFEYIHQSSYNFEE